MRSVLVVAIIGTTTLGVYPSASSSVSSSTADERAVSPLQGACDILISSEVELAFKAVAGQAASAEVQKLRDLNLAPLVEALQLASHDLADRGLILVADLHHCNRIVNSAKTCPGSANLLNTGLENHHPEDTERDLLRWHGAEAFAGKTISYPPVDPTELQGAPQSRLRCWAILP